MPIVFRYNESENTLFVVADGNLSLPDFTHYFEQIGKLNLQPGVRCLSDLGNSRIDFNMQDMVESDTPPVSPLCTIPDAKVALCIGADCDGGLIRIYAAFNKCNKLQAQVFSSVAEGRRWLEL